MSQEPSRYASYYDVGLYFPYGMEGMEVWTDSAHRGCSSEFGKAQITVGPAVYGGHNVYEVPTSGGDNYYIEHNVAANTQVAWTAIPDSSNGFVFDKWYLLSDPGRGISQNQTYSKENLSGNTYLVPSFKPGNVTYKRQISLSVRGRDLEGAVNVSSMLAYFSYDVSSIVSGATVNFNGQGQDKLPDRENITLKVKMSNGWSVTVKANNSEVIPQTSQNTGQLYNAGENLEGHIDGPGESTRSGSELIEERSYYITYIVPNNTAGSLSIDVEYTSVTPSYTLEVREYPSGVGVVTAYSGTRPIEPQPIVTAESGTEVHAEVIRTPARYQFDGWKEDDPGGTTVSTETDYSFELQQDKTLFGVFSKIYTTISVGTSGGHGSAVIRINGNPIQNTTISSNDPDLVGKTISVTAIPDNGYEFLKWVITSGTRQTESEEPTITGVTFDSEDKTYTAQFVQTHQNCVTVSAKTRSYDGTDYLDGPSDSRVSFGVRYVDQNSVPETKTVGNETQTFSSLIRNEHTYIELSNNLTSDLVLDENGERYRYSFSKFAYRITGESVSQYIDISGESPFTWEPYVVQNKPLELVAIYTKTRLYTVKLSSVNTGGISIDNYIDLTGAGSGYEYDEQVTINAETKDGVDPDKFDFVEWMDMGNSGQTISDSSSYSFAIQSDCDYRAEFTQYCQLTAEPDVPEHGSVSIDTDPDKSTDLWEYGSSVQVTATPQTGYLFDHWELNRTPVPGGNPFNVNVVNDTSLVAVFIDGENTLTVRSSEGGQVGIQVRPSELAEWQTRESSDGEYSIPDGYDVLATAVPNPGYSFNGFKLYESGSADPTDISNSASFVIDGMDSDMLLDASFSYVPWISRLTTIMKVY